MKKKILTRNNNNNDLNLFLSTSDKSQKKITFNIDKERPDKQINPKTKIKKQKYLNIFLKNLNNKKKYNSNEPTKIIILNGEDYKSKNKSNVNLNIQRYNDSLYNTTYNRLKTIKFSRKSKIFLNDIIKINKPTLLSLLNRDILKKDSQINKEGFQAQYTAMSTDKNKINDDYIFEKSTSSRINLDNQKNKNKNIRYNTINNSEIDNLNAFRKTFLKFPKIKLSFPLQMSNYETSDKKEMKDKINQNYFADEKLKKKLKKALYFDLNSSDDDFGKYSEYKKSKENYINYIYDINIVPHIKNRFLYSKPIYESRKINTILFSKNLINKEDAKSLNRFLINNMRKEEIEKEKIKERERKMKELSATNNYLQKLCLDYEDENFPKMTSDEIVEITDFFEKNINYNFVTFANNKLKNIVYKVSNKKRNNKSL